MTVILTTGGRYYGNYNEVRRQLLHIKDKYAHDLIIVQGGATGADQLVRETCELLNIPCATVPAYWETHGKKAGPIRNIWMMRLKPKEAIAFPGGKGTNNMLEILQQANVFTTIVPEQMEDKGAR